MQQNKNFTQGDIYKPLIRFALPLLAAIFLQTTYSAVDLMIVGLFAQAADVSAVSTGSWLMHLVTVLVVGISMGTTILLGNCIGKSKPEEGNAIILNSTALFILLGLILTAAVYGLADPITALMQTPPEAYAKTVSYLQISALGSIFIVGYNVIGAVFRGIGNSTLPFLTVAIACLFNIAGDYILVGHYHMAGDGAAIATVAAQALSVVISLFIIQRMKLPFHISWQPQLISKPGILKVFRLGFPIALQDELVGISFLALQAIVNAMGVTASAGVGIAEKMCGFIMLIPMAFSQSMSAFVAQNMGARKPERAQKALQYAISTSLAVGVVTGYCSYFHGDSLIRLFTPQPEVIMAGWAYLQAYAFDCLLVSFLFCFIGYFTGCSQTRFVMIQGIIGAFAIRIPVSYYMSLQEPVSIFMVGMATPASTLVQIILCGGFFYWLNQNKLKMGKF